MADEIKRLNYFNGQFLVADDFKVEQEYHLELQRDHELLRHTPGVAQGLDIPAPLPGAGDIVVNSGFAYDDLGRRIVLGADKTIALPDDEFPEGSIVYVTIHFKESPTDEKDYGVKGDTRWTETAGVEAKLTASVATPTYRPLLLAVVTKSGQLSVDSSARLIAGTKGGDLRANSVTLSNDAVAQGSWPKLQLSPGGATTFNGALTLTAAAGLTVNTNIHVNGTVDGRDVKNDGSALDAHLANDHNPHHVLASQIDAEGGTNRIVTQINAGTGTIQEPRIDSAIARQSAVTKITSDLASQSTPTGASTVGNDAFGTAPNNVAAGNLRTQLSSLLGLLTSQSTPTGASTVGNDAITSGSTSIAAGTLRTQLSSLLTALTGHTGASEGAHAASAVSVADSANQIAATSVEGALAEIMTALLGGHATDGQHKTIRQPSLPVNGGMAVLFDSNGGGWVSSHVRMLNDTNYLWITINASWNGTAWARDHTSYPATAIRLSRLDFALLYEDTFAATFTDWTKTWKLPMSSTANTGWELIGSFRESGWMGTTWINNDPSTSKQQSSGAAVMFRSRFPSTPSSITFAASTAPPGSELSGPFLMDADRDGFYFEVNWQAPPNRVSRWIGKYTAIG